MAKKHNLAGHKRDGKRFIPPLMQLPGMRQQSYVKDMLPELIWLGLIHDRKGYVFGRHTLEVVVDVVKDRESDDSGSGNFAMQYAYSSLSQEEKQRIVQQWRSRSMLHHIQHALAPLTLLYDDEFSMRFVGPPETAIPREALVRQIRDCVANHLDKYHLPAVALHGSLMLTRLLEGKLRFTKDIDIPDFNAAFNAPDSEEGRRAAGFMRASALGEMGMLDVSNSWARHFWNRNAVLSPCEYPSLVEDANA